MKKILLFTSFFLFLFSFSNATTVLGADISYKNIGQEKYEVTLKIYRDCTGVGLGNISYNVSSGTNSKSYLLNKKGVKDVTPTCKTSVNSCNNSNSTFPGIEEHLYKDTIDLSQSPYKTWISNGACEINFNWQQCCRNTAITTINGGSFYTEAILNYCNVNKTKRHFNNSCFTTNSPIAFLCCNNPYYFNNGSLDSLDHDSISYALVAPKSGPTTTLTHKSPFDPKHPMTCKCIPPGRVNCKPVPNAKPPLGFYLDSYNGDLVFTPTKCDEIGIVVIEVKEWRKDSSGNYVNTGTTRRDLQFTVMNCGSNWPPEVKASKYDYSVCEGDKIKINIEGKDQPHPSDPNGRKDTVTLSWNGGLHGKGSYKVTNPKDREKKSVFEWQTQIGDAQDNPYTFTVKAQDDACPLNAISIKGFSIKVLPRPRILSKTFTTYCDKIIADVKIVDDGNAPYFYNWKLYDSAYSSVLMESKNKARDTFTVKNNSTYYMKLQLNNANNCPRIIIDTIRFAPLLGHLYLGKDTTIEYNDTIIFHAGNGFTSYLWNDNSTDSILKINALDIGPGKHSISVEVENDSGCKYTDLLLLEVKNCGETINLGTDTTISINDTLVLSPGANYLNYLWNDNSTDSTLIIRATDVGIGTYIYSVLVEKKIGCKVKDEIKVTIDGCTNNPIPKLYASNSSYTICEGDLIEFDLEVRDTFNSKYKYRDSVILDYLSSKGNFALSDSTSKNKKGTFTWQTVKGDASMVTFNAKFKYYDDACPAAVQYKQVSIHVNALPKASLNNFEECGKYKMEAILSNDFVNPAKYKWEITDKNTSKIVFTSTLAKPIFYIKTASTYEIKLHLENANGCEIELLETKTLKSIFYKDLLGKDRSMFTHDTIVLNPGTFKQYLWSDNSRADTLEVVGLKLGKGSKFIYLLVFDSLNCAYSDTINLVVKCSPNTLNIGKDKTIDIWDLLVLSANRDFSTYDWNTGSKNKTTNIRADLLGTGTHTFSLNVKDQANCVYTDTMKLTVTNLTSIKDSKIEKLTVFPSPTKDYLQIELPQGFKEGKIEIINLIGKTIFTKVVTNSNGKNLELDVSHLPKGFYILKLTTNKKKYLTKFIKE